MEKGFGRAMRPLWALRPDATFLNHGSFGACPLAVLAVQDRLRREMEEQPDRFFLDRIVPGADKATALRAVADALGEFVGVSGNNVALLENATSGTQAVLNSVSFEPGDQILITNHQYNAVRLAVETRCRETGATPLVVQIPMRASYGEIRACIRDAANRKVKLAIVDHITSPTALVFPIRDIIADLHELAIPVLVDGAHALGQIPLDLADIEPEWYVSNAHKWLYSPKGSAFLYAAPQVAGMTRPTTVSHFVELGFPRAFDYVGTRDCTGWLAIPAAITFLEELGFAEFRDHNQALLERAAGILADVGAEPIAPLEMCGAMRSFALPQSRELQPDDGIALRDALWHEERVQVAGHAFGASLLVRISAQAYVDEEDLSRLKSALERRGWPGR